MNPIQQKIAKTGKVLSVILLVSCILVIFPILMNIIGIMALLFAGGEKDVLSALQGIYSQTQVLSVQQLAILFLLSLVYLFMLFFLHVILYHIFADISRNYTPFEKQQVIRMKRVAILTFVMCVFGNIYTGIQSAFLEEVTMLDFSTMDFNWLITAIVIYCMAHIFDYGYQLQTQSDLTL